MKKLILSIAFGCIVTTLFAQSTIVLQKADEVYTSSKIDSIMAHAEDGNTIYLPGGIIILKSELIINKKLSIYGVGHFPDSCKATNVTYISGGAIKISESGSGSTLSGFVTDNDMYLNTSNSHDVKFVNVNRVKMRTLVLGSVATFRNVPTSNIMINECVITGGIFAGDAHDLLFTKNLIKGQMRYFTNGGIFENNIFFEYNSSYGLFRDCVGLNINNNIIAKSSYSYLSGSILNNNLFLYTHGDAPYYNNLGSGNIDCLSIDSVFVNSDGTGFSYADDYHLKPTCPGINAGTDGTNVGIYGTDTPFKSASVPVTPHISKIVVAKKSTNGKLPVEIQVSAQDN